MSLVPLALLLALAAPDTNRAPADSADSLVATPSTDSTSLLAAAPADTIRRRHAIQYSDAYAVRLKIHRIGSYTMLPLFAAEYALGQNLLNDASPSGWIKPAHTGVALGIAALFTVNTVTGAWNLWESRNDPADRVRRYLHSSIMIASDAGFLWTGAVAGGRRTNLSREQHHRNVALVSIGLSTAGTVMMWLWKT